MGKIEKLESIRGFAAVYIIIHHLVFFNQLKFIFLGIDFAKVFSFGVEVVMIFFILSGFVINYSFTQGRDKSFKLFFYKRFVRIFVPLIAVFIATAALQYFQGGMVGFKLSRLVGNMLMLQDLSFKTNALVKPLFDNGPLWSLSYEWWYYMIYFAICTYAAKTKQSSIIYAMVILAAVSYLFYPFAINRWIMYMIVWWIGVELSNIYRDGKVISFKSLSKPIVVFAASVLILGIGAFAHSSGLIVNKDLEFDAFVLAHAFIILAVALLWHKIGWKGFKYTLEPFKHIASISYGVYISHMFLIIQATYLDFIDNVYLRYSLYIAVCLLFSYFIERVLFVKVNAFLKPRLFKK